MTTLADKLKAAEIPYVAVVEETATVETSGLNLSDEQTKEISMIIAEHVGEVQEPTIDERLAATEDALLAITLGGL